MDSYTYKDGVTVKVGDYTTAYAPGVHQIVSMTERKGREPLVSYRTIFNGKNKRVNGKSTKDCSVLFCRPVVAQRYKDKLAEITKDYEELIKFLS